MIIGITGRAGCGKSTLAEALFADTSAPTKILSFAAPLRDVVEAVFGSRYETQEEKAAIDPYWQNRLGPDWQTGRQILQRVGTELFRVHVHPDLWLFCMERQLGTTAHTIIPDVRFDNEAEFVLQRGGMVIDLRRPDQSRLYPKTHHASERGIHSGLVTAIHSCDCVGAIRSLGRHLAKLHLT